MPQSPGRLHDDEAPTDAALARRLLAAQFPRWADLPIEPVAAVGTGHAVHRLGSDLAVRLPRIPKAALQVDKEHRWLPRLAPHLPLAIPTPVARGAPGEGFPWPWSVYRWIEGADAADSPPADAREAARDLARFVAALRDVDPTDGPPPGGHNSLRGAPLSAVDAQARAALAALEGVVDVRGAAAAWDAALAVPPWHGPPVWVHGDLRAANLLVRDGRLCAVIDFGLLGVGDPACDAMVAWVFLPASARDLFREALAVDDATWARGRGWALWWGLVALPYYRATHLPLAAAARRAIDEVLADRA
jgi:aminoglycoside phosphotransferase (APT) family kinase protein